MGAGGNFEWHEEKCLQTVVNYTSITVRSWHFLKKCVNQLIFLQLTLLTMEFFTLFPRLSSKILKPESLGYWRNLIFTELYGSFFWSSSVTHKIKISSLEMSQLSLLTLNKAFFLHRQILQLSINKSRKLILHLLFFFFTDVFIDYHLGSVHSSAINPPSNINRLGFFPKNILSQAGFLSLDWYD